MSEPLRPRWLPEQVSFHGDWDAFVRALYAIFEADFKDSRPQFRACPLWHDRRVESNCPFGFEEGFWHLITREDWVYNPRTRRREKERLPEFDRAGRMPWAKPIIDNERDDPVLVWEFDDETRKGKATRTYLWLRDFDYVVILEEQSKRFGTVFRLITSFYVDVEAKRKDLLSRYERRLK